jgi:hypothetical protein
LSRVVITLFSQNIQTKKIMLGKQSNHLHWEFQLDALRSYLNRIDLICI